MGKVNRFLLMLIAMVAIMIAAVGIDRGMKYINIRRWEKERVVKNEQARADVAEIQMTISQLSNDQEAIEAFIEENRAYFEIDEEAGFRETGSGEEFEEDPGREGTGEGQRDHLPGEGMEGVSGNGAGSVSGNWTEDVSGNWVRDVSGNWTGDVSGNWARDISGNWIRDISGNWASVSGNWQAGVQMWGNNTVSGNTLLEKRKIRASYMETQMQNKEDLKTIAENSYDFSEMSIACLGDSITEAANLDGMEDYQQYSYPTRLKEILGAKSVTNLGIGGSSIGRYWDNAFVDRFEEIPKETGLIIVMGGTNDGFCLDMEDFGTMEERKERTFIGDLDELMRGLKENYPDSDIVFVTPLPNILHDMLRKERDYLLSQTVIAGAIKQLSEEYGIPVIDLYNSNMLDTHDAAVIYNYMPDGVHCNENGYTLLAEHIAAELIRIYAQEEEEGDDPEMEDSSENGADGENNQDSETGQEENTGQEDESDREEGGFL